MVGDAALEATAPTVAPASWKRTVGTLAGIALGAVLLFASYAKAIDPAAFTEQVVHEGLDFALSGQWVMYIALGLEILLGLLLLMGVRRLWVLIPVTLLVAFFLFLTGRAWYRDAHGLGDHAPCGCFGNLLDRTPKEAFLQDLALMAPLALLAWLGRPKGPPQPKNRLGWAAAGTVAALVFTSMAPLLPLDDLATRIAPGVDVRTLCAGHGEDRICLADERGLLPRLAEGTHFVVVSGLSEDAFLDAVPRLNEQFEKANPPLVVLTTVEKEDELHSALEWDHAAAFRAEIGPPGLIRPMYRRLPRSFLIQSGKVTKTWDGIPQNPDLGQ